MRYIVILLVCVVSFNAAGQIDNQKLQYLNKVQKFRTMRSIGLVMVVAGATMGIVGFTRIINTPSTATVSDQDVKLFMAGAPFFAGGLPISIIGHGNMKKYEKKLRVNSGVSFNFIFTPQTRGLTLTYRF